MNIFVRMGEIVSKYYSWLLQGVGYTLLVSLLSTVAGLVIGVLIGVYRTAPTPKNKFLKALKKAAAANARHPASPRTSKFFAARP